MAVKCAHCDTWDRVDRTGDGFLCSAHWARVDLKLRDRFYRALRALHARRTVANVGAAVVLMRECKADAVAPKDLFDTGTR